MQNRTVLVFSTRDFQLLFISQSYSYKKRRVQPLIHLFIYQSIYPSINPALSSSSSFLGLYPCHMEVPRLGFKSELQLPVVYATATAMQDLSHICNLHHSSWQHRILNPLNEARDPTWVLVDTSWVFYQWATTGTPHQSSPEADRQTDRHTHTYTQRGQTGVGGERERERESACIKFA